MIETMHHPYFAPKGDNCFIGHKLALNSRNNLLRPPYLLSSHWSRWSLLIAPLTLVFAIATISFFSMRQAWGYHLGCEYFDSPLQSLTPLLAPICVLLPDYCQQLTIFALNHYLHMLEDIESYMNAYVNYHDPKVNNSKDMTRTMVSTTRKSLTSDATTF
jgi:hypothetical protein